MIPRIIWLMNIFIHIIDILFFFSDKTYHRYTCDVLGLTEIIGKLD